MRTLELTITDSLGNKKQIMESELLDALPDSEIIKCAIAMLNSLDCYLLKKSWGLIAPTSQPVTN